MPRGDGTGPQGQGSRTGMSRGNCNTQDSKTPSRPQDGGQSRGQGGSANSGKGNGRGQRRNNR